MLHWIVFVDDTKQIHYLKKSSNSHFIFLYTSKSFYITLLDDRKLHLTLDSIKNTYLKKMFSVFILHTVVYIILQFFQTKLPKQQQENNSRYSISIIWRPKTYPPNIYVYISEQNIDLTPKNTLLKSHVKVN